MNTVSAPAGIGAPVKMRIAWPASTGAAAALPAVRRPAIVRRVSSLAVRSPWRTA
jgi:hypothetical protein